MKSRKSDYCGCNSSRIALVLHYCEYSDLSRPMQLFVFFLKHFGTTLGFAVFHPILRLLQ